MPKIAKLSFKHFSAPFMFVTTLLFTYSIARIKPGNLTQFTQQDGFSGGQVNRMLQDNFGNNWHGTFNGLARYNGYELERYFSNRNDSTFTKDELIKSLDVFSVIYI